MKYMGSKRRIAKYIIPIILADRKPGQVFVDVTVGGANASEDVANPRICADVNPYLIALFKSTQIGWQPPKHISEELYNDVKNAPFNYSQELVGHLGFAMSYGGKFFGGLARGNCDLKNGGVRVRDYGVEAFNNFTKQAPKLAGAEFICCSYSELAIPKNSIIYADPPYKGTTGYKDGGFDHVAFWQWCRDKTNEGHQVFISEYAAPDDFLCIWEGENHSTFGTKTAKKATEKLFIYL